MGGGLPVRHLHFNLPQDRYDLLWLVISCRHDLTSSSSGFSLFPLGTKRAGQVKSEKIVDGINRFGYDKIAFGSCILGEIDLKGLRGDAT